MEDITQEILSRCKKTYRNLGNSHFYRFDNIQDIIKSLQEIKPAHNHQSSPIKIHGICDFQTYVIPLNPGSTQPRFSFTDLTGEVEVTTEDTVSRFLKDRSIITQFRFADDYVGDYYRLPIFSQTGSLHIVSASSPGGDGNIYIPSTLPSSGLRLPRNNPILAT